MESAHTVFAGQHQNVELLFCGGEPLFQGHRCRKRDGFKFFDGDIPLLVKFLTRHLFGREFDAGNGGGLNTEIIYENGASILLTP